MSAEADLRWMRAALALGRRGLGRTAPNPSVGCLVVKEGRVLGRVLGRGVTAPGGRPHGETIALAQAGEAARGATAYVTLEPCSHHGQTPPCCDALIAAGVARVVVATGDPNPAVAGQGIARLRAAGIAVDVGLCKAEARRDHAGFLSVQERGRPMVTLKLAGSFDGRIATATGQSQWITGPEARRAVHAQRARHDAVMVGGGTVRSDDPALTVRGLGIDRQPARVVLSRRLDLPLDGQLARTAGQVPVILCHGPDVRGETLEAWTGLGARCLPCPVLNGQVDPGAALAALAGAGLTRIYCEGGGSLAASLLALGLVDEVVGFTAGLMLGAEGTPSLGAMGVDRLAEAPRFALVGSRQVGPDLMHVWRAAV